MISEIGNPFQRLLFPTATFPDFSFFNPQFAIANPQWREPHP